MARRKTSNVHTTKATTTAAQKVEATKAVVEEKTVEVKEAVKETAAKAEEAAKETVEKVAEKATEAAAEVKETAKETAEKAVEKAAETVEKTAEAAKTTAKKTATKAKAATTKKAAAAKKTVKAKADAVKTETKRRVTRKPTKKIVLQYLGKEFDEAELTERAIAQFNSVEGGVAVKTITMYLKPEESELLNFFLKERLLATETKYRRSFIKLNLVNFKPP